MRKGVGTEFKSISNQQEETSLDEFFNLGAMEMLTLFEHLEFAFLSESDVLDHPTSTSTLATED